MMSANECAFEAGPSGSPPWTIDLVNGDHFVGSSTTPAAVAGYPSITVPAGYAVGLPVGISFIGRRWSEAQLIKYAYLSLIHISEPTRLLSILYAVFCL